LQFFHQGLAVAADGRQQSFGLFGRQPLLRARPVSLTILLIGLWLIRLTSLLALLLILLLILLIALLAVLLIRLMLLLLILLIALLAALLIRLFLLVLLPARLVLLILILLALLILLILFLLILILLLLVLLVLLILVLLLLLLQSQLQVVFRVLIVWLQAQGFFILRDGRVELLGVVRDIAQIEVHEFRDGVVRLR